MIRSSDLALALLLAAPAGAEPLVSDAFGLYDPAAAGDRAAWSGLTSAGSIAPGTPDRIVIFAGPKSLVAGKDAGHVVAIIVDRAGNLVADGTPATLTVAGVRTAVRTEGGIAQRLIPPATGAGDLFAGVASGDRQSPKAMLSVVADVGSIRPQIASPLPDAQAETVVEIASAPLADRFGNPVPDGTGATLLLTHRDGSHSLAFGQALGDRVQARLIARDIPGTADATLTLGAHSAPSVPLTITAPTPSGPPALLIEPLPAIAAHRVTLGPFLTTDGYALSDGAQVSLTARLADGTSFTDSAWSQDGSVSLLLPLASPSEVASIQVHSPLGLLDLTDDWTAAAAALADGASP
jgi:hypothetical protein